MLQGKCCVQSNLFITVTLEKWATAICIYIQVSFKFNWMLSSFNVCSSPIRLPWKGWFDDFASIHFCVYFGAHILKFALDLIVIQFVDRYKQVKYSGIEHFGSLKSNRIRYREDTALYRSTLRNTYRNIFGELFSSRSIQGDRYIQGLYILVWLLIRQLMRGNAFLI